MNTFLIFISLTTAALAAVAVTLAWRTLQQERRRADARVAALAASRAAGTSAPPIVATHFDSARFAGPANADDAYPDPETALDSFAQTTDANADTIVRYPATAAKPVAPAVVADAPDLNAFGRGLFGSEREAQEVNPLPRLAPVLAGTFVMVVAALLLWLGARTGTPTAEAAAQPDPLELLSLTHTRQGKDVTITGLVRNPKSARPLEAVTAVIYFFDREGSFLASARAPLDFRKLAAGDESPFQVTVPAPAGLSRYRVSFRHEEGGVLPHVDRREGRPGTSAGPAGPPERPAPLAAVAKG
ncbi:MAG TPA: hypothetical protein VIL35_08160 [Vicinamibacterales bacterium]